MRLSVHHIATIQNIERDTLKVRYQWHPTSDTMQAVPDKVWITFLKPSPEHWKWLMTQETDGFEIVVLGTRNKPHDGLDDCYVEVLEEVNKERTRIGLEPVLL